MHLTLFYTTKMNMHKHVSLIRARSKGISREKHRCTHVGTCAPAGTRLQHETAISSAQASLTLLFISGINAHLRELVHDCLWCVSNKDVKVQNPSDGAEGHGWSGLQRYLCHRRGQTGMQ